ncbi:ABC transporter substrate-binding protein [Xylophilus ampelinus]|uniref:Carbohydrate ABC transporter substrate-binding protein (CUT1 family) n=1 Tax=Xylophilus ampelinus TaxID=54067 RepID=A0A318SPE9_9BURK|nr:extracellular solute-binding protein [Xylophilus ampelinus]MCS4509409.1 extracellular solute-binding protein [Xylophilus ampelinus]PYE79131.1 carbohydrate ABC transporter substrate-binding protein (CUT1 family) [Xylophilus ampelinus]
MQRRDIVRAGGLSLFGAVLPFGSSRAQDRYAKYRGQSVVVSVPAHPHYEAMLRLLPAFTRETGIKVEVDKLQILRMKDKQLLEMAKPQGDYDLVSYVVMWKGEYVKKNLVRELEPFMKNPALADPAFDLQDIVPAYRENIGLVGGPRGYLAGAGAKLYGLPYGAETSILAYRHDIFARHDLKPPQTYAELQGLLPILQARQGIGALTSRGQAGHQCVHAWLLHLNPLGGKVFDADWRPRFNDEAGVKALALLKQVSDTGPAGIPSYGQGEMMTAFLQGQASMYLDSTIVFGQVNDPARSRIAGKVGYALHPKGARYASQSGGLGLAIPRNAKNADAAFLLMQWLTSKQQDVAVAKAGGVPIRDSTLADADLVRQYPEYITLREQLKYSDPDWRPIIPEWDEINIQALGVAISEALTGKKTPKDALDGVVPKVTEIMRRGGYLKA